MSSVKHARRTRAGRLFVPLVFLICCSVFLPAPAAAQVTADIVGTVTDNSGAVIPNATVTVKNVGTNLTRTQPTSASGQYSFTLLPLGNYTVTVEAVGFKIFTAPQFTLAAGDRARVNATLEVGAISEMVEVTAESIGVLQTDSATVGGLLTSTAVQDLPVNARNFVRLVQLAPGITEGKQLAELGGTRVDDRRETNSASANGQDEGSNNWLLDGMDNNDRNIGTIVVKPSIDALEEVKVDTSLYPAEVGRAGGAVVNMITKSGTNAFHGSVFEYIRNDKFDAKDFFNTPQAGNALAGKKPPFRQNQFGGSIGGPIVKNKAFFFADYEAFRKVKGLPANITVPTSCQLGTETCNGIKQVGNFSDSSLQIYDPITHVPFANNVIPSSRLSQFGKNFIQLFPSLPRSSCGDTCQFFWSPKESQFAHTGDMRIDYHFSDKDLLFGRFSYNTTSTRAPGWLPPVTVAGVKIESPSADKWLFNFPGLTDQSSFGLALSYTHIFSPGLSLQLSVMGDHYAQQALPYTMDQDVTAAFGGLSGFYKQDVWGASGLPMVWFNDGGYASMGDTFAMPMRLANTNYQYMGTLNWIKGSHTVKFGASVKKLNYSVQQELMKGTFIFANFETNSFGGFGGSGGSALASMLTGYYFLFMRSMMLAYPQMRGWEHGWFVQDNWRVNSWLTLNLGLRYDIFTPPSEKHNKISNFDPTDPATLAGKKILMAGQEGVSEALNFTAPLNNLQPRTGFAATLGKGTVLRGGFGMAKWPGAVHSPGRFRNAPFSANNSIMQTIYHSTLNWDGSVPPPTADSPCLTTACGASPDANISLGNSIQMKRSNTTVYMFNLTLEREFAGNTLSVGWVGQIMRHLQRSDNVNQNLPPLDPGGCGVTTSISFPSPCLPYYSQLPLVNQIPLMRMNGTGIYHALQVIFQRRLKAGLTVSSNYSWSKALGNTGNTGGGCGGCGIILNNLQYDYGPSDYDVRHKFAFTANYTLPTAKSLKGFLSHVVNGWQINDIMSVYSGTHFTVQSSAINSNVVNLRSDRPDWRPQASFTQSLNQWFDTTAFRLQTFGHAGNEGRNKFTMPGAFRTDLSVFKDFRVTESVKVQFRAEMFNLTNHPSFGEPGSTISVFDGSGVPTQAGNFGRITETSRMYTPRDIQFALRLIF